MLTPTAREGIWEKLELVTPAASSVVSLEEAKAHLRVDHSADDTLITSLIEVATASIEGPYGYGVSILTQTWKFDTEATKVFIPLTPVRSITSVVDADDDAITYTIADQLLKLTDVGTTPYTVTFVSGYTTAPTLLKHAVLLMVAHLYHDREGAKGEPLGFLALINRYRVGRFG